MKFSIIVNYRKLCYTKNMKLILLGTGTSHGVPVIGCDCKVCRSKSKKDKRFRSAACVTGDDGKLIQIDTGPEFRMQAIKYKIKKLDAVLLTHNHSDHMFGLDDLRIFSFDLPKVPDDTKHQGYFAPPIPIYTNETTENDLKNKFDYLFKPVKEGGGRAKITLNTPHEPFNIGNTTVTPIPMMHGHLETTGWLLTHTQNGVKKSAAYLTDCSFIPESSIKLIKQNAGILEHLVIDGLRIKEHSTHFNFLQALSAAEKVCPNHVWLTHLTHLTSHKDVKTYIKKHIKEFPGLKNSTALPAYDGLVLKW